MADSRFAELPSITFGEGFTLPSPTDTHRGTVVLFHGLTGMPAEVTELAHFLNDRGFAAVVPRLSGHGDNVHALSGVRLGAWLEDVERAFAQGQELGGPLFVVGMSFGGLLGLHLASRERCPISALVVASVPFRLRSATNEVMLRMLARFPDRVLDRCGTRKKQRRLRGYLAVEHNAYPEHSVGALARMVQLRSRVRSRLAEITCPVAIFQDPFDHHLAPASALLLQEGLRSAPSTVHQIPHGEHELFLGHYRREIFEQILRFFLEAHERRG